MAFFGNNAVNYLNLHYGIHSIALGGGGAFFMVYLLNSGVPVPAVFVSLAAILLGRFIVRPLVVGLVGALWPARHGGRRHADERGAVSAARRGAWRRPRALLADRGVCRRATPSTGRPTTPISPRSAMTSIAASRSACAKRSRRWSAS